MKLEKKHAVASLNFIVEYLENGYYPVDDTVNESAMISKIFGFGKHQKLIETKVVTEWVRKRNLPAVKNTARLDLTTDEGSAILDMYGESVGKDIDETDEYKRLKNYLTKLQVADE